MQFGLTVSSGLTDKLQDYCVLARAAKERRPDWPAEPGVSGHAASRNGERRVGVVVGGSPYVLGTAETVVLSGLTGERWGLHEVSNRLRSWPLAQFLATVTMLDRSLLKGITDVATQERMVKRCCPDSSLRKQVVRELREGRIVFYPRQLSAAVQLAAFRDSASAQGSGECLGGDDEFLKTLMALSDLLSDEAAPRVVGDDVAKMLTSMTVGDVPANTQESFGDLFLRYWTLFVDLEKPLCGNTGAVRFDLHQEFAEAVGISLPKALAVGCYLAERAFSRHMLCDKSSAFDLRACLDELNLRGSEREAIVRLLVLKQDDFRPEDTALICDPSVLMQHPVVETEGKAFVPMLNRLWTKMTDGLYWELHDRLGDQDRSRLHDSMGARVEEYVRQRFTGIMSGSGNQHGRIINPIKYRKGQCQSSDVIIHIERTLICVEVKAARPAFRDTKVNRSDSSIQSDFGKLICGPLSQIDRVIRDFRSRDLQLAGLTPGDIDSYIPVVVSLEAFPMMMWIQNAVSTYLAEKNLLQGSDICAPVVMDVGELESLESVTVLGDHNIVTLLRQYLEGILRFGPFANFLSDRYPQANGDPNKIDRFRKLHVQIKSELGVSSCWTSDI